MYCYVLEESKLKNHVSNIRNKDFQSKKKRSTSVKLENLGKTDLETAIYFKMH